MMAEGWNSGKRREHSKQISAAVSKRTTVGSCAFYVVHSRTIYQTETLMDKLKLGGGQAYNRSSD
jgi:hypothetical protein